MANKRATTIPGQTGQATNQLAATWVAKQQALAQASNKESAAFKVYQEAHSQRSGDESEANIAQKHFLDALESDQREAQIQRGQRHFVLIQQIVDQIWANSAYQALIRNQVSSVNDPNLYHRICQVALSEKFFEVALWHDTDADKLVVDLRQVSKFNEVLASKLQGNLDGWWVERLLYRALADKVSWTSEAEVLAHLINGDNLEAVSWASSVAEVHMILNSGGNIEAETT